MERGATSSNGPGDRQDSVTVEHVDIDDPGVLVLVHGVTDPKSQGRSSVWRSVPTRP